ncbi:MAG: GAF domain-containing protein, partial [Gemmatimonadota bacterium]
ALAAGELSAEQEAELLELRAESLYVRGENDRCAEDARALADLARREHSPSIEAIARRREALLHLRRGDGPAAVKAARAALKAARRGAREDIEGLCLSALGWLMSMVRIDAAKGPALAQRAVSIFERIGPPVYLARAWLYLGNTHVSLERPREANEASARALALARQCGDLSSQGTALNLLGWFEPNQAEVLRLRQQALAAYTEAGNLYGRAIIIGNLGSEFVGMGLYRRARRLLLEADRMHAAMGSLAPRAVNFGNLFEAELTMGRLDAARAAGREASRLVRSLGLRRFSGYPAWAQGRLALEEGRAAEAARLFERAAKEQGAHGDGPLMTMLSDAARAYVAAGQPAKALAASRRAIALHRAKGLSWIDGMEPPYLWWWHSRALRASGLRDEADKALARAYRFVVERNAQVGDEGLRRNALNKKEAVRELIAAWVAHARDRRLPKSERETHLAVQANLSEPFERLVDTGLRLNEIRTEAELCEFLVDEVTELSGAERVLLVLERGGELQVAGSLLPKGESEAALMQAVTPWLLEARRTRAASLRHGPDGVDTIDQRSCLVVPLVAQRELLGYLYADIEGLFGRFHDGDTQLLGMLAAQAALTLANVRAAAGLERKVEERTEQLNDRVRELEVINAIQRGVAAELNFQAIVDLVGDKLREVLGLRDIGISWYEPNTRRVHALYIYERGRRLSVEPYMMRVGGPGEQMIATRRPVIYNTLAELTAAGIYPMPGTEPSKSVLFMPIVGSDRVIGDITLENYERENAFGDAEVRLLQTVTASLGVALENARLFDETQRLLKETEQRNAELAVINSVQQGIAGSLNFQGIVDLVGDKLRQVFNTGDISIRWFDQDADQAHLVYTYEHGVHLPATSYPLSKASAATQRLIETRRPNVFNSIAEQLAADVTARPGTDQARSMAYVPIIGRDRVIGAVGLENHERDNAFGESELRLLQTVASSMGVALESARLFDETQRLLKETEQRAAELAVINTIQQGLASSLELQAVIDLVGERLMALFSADVARIDLFDRERNVISFPFVMDHGERFRPEPFEVGNAPSLSAHAMREGKTLVFHTIGELESFQRVQHIPGVELGGGTVDNSFVYCPLLIDRQPIGLIVIGKQSEHAFSASDVKLIETVAASLSLALQNARSFEAERRRVAELAVINSIQQGIAGSLDFQGIVDLVGDRLREVLGVQDLGIEWFDHEAHKIHPLYVVEHGRRLEQPPRQMKPGGPTERLLTTREPEILNTVAEGLAQGGPAPGTDQSKSSVGVPIIGNRV